MSTLNFTSIPTKILAESITASATSFKLNNIEGWDGNNLTSADFGSIGYGVFRNATNTQLEIFEWDTSTIASTSITINKRGLKFDGNVTTQVTANKLDWTKGDTYVDLGTDTPQMLQYIQNYVDAAIVAGGVPATTSVLGLVKMSIAPASPTSPIAVGDNDTRVPTQGENDATAGGGSFGTPSSSNKFITETYVTNVQKIDTFTASGTWTKPIGAKSVRVFVVGAGGGGGGGSYNTTNPWGVGGGGGQGGGLSELSFPASILGATETVTVGTGGTGGAGRAGSNGNGTDGTAGGDSSFGAWLVATGGAKGTGTGTGGTGAGIGNVGTGTAGGNGSTGSNPGSVGVSTTTFAPTGGAGGAGANGGTGSSGGSRSAVATLAGGSPGSNGNAVTSNLPIGGTGAGSGASPTVGGTAYPGGNGGLYGGGGGGGAGSGGTNTGGAGGNGANGIIVVISYL